MLHGNGTVTKCNTEIEIEIEIEINNNISKDISYEKPSYWNFCY